MGGAHTSGDASGSGGWQMGRWHHRRHGGEAGVEQPSGRAWRSTAWRGWDVGKQRQSAAWGVGNAAGASSCVRQAPRALTTRRSASRASAATTFTHEGSASAAGGSSAGGTRTHKLSLAAPGSGPFALSASCRLTSPPSCCARALLLPQRGVCVQGQDREEGQQVPRDLGQGARSMRSTGLGACACAAVDGSTSASPADTAAAAWQR